MMYSLITLHSHFICIDRANVLTGMVSYATLNCAVGDPLAFVFGTYRANVTWIAGHYC